MDINCTDNCEHQYEGKCNLIETPNVFVSAIDEDSETNLDCPYFIKKAKE